MYMDNSCVLLFGVPIFIIIIYNVLMKVLKNRDEKKKPTKLPPGSLGLPFFGETIQLYTQDPNLFFSTRQKRYGEIFKTRILGCPSVMLACPEAARFVLVNQAHLFKPTYPQSKENLIGPWALFFHEGEYHARLRRLVQACFYPETLRRLLPNIQDLTLSALTSWAGGRVINTFAEMKRLSFEVGILVIFGNLESRFKDELKKNYAILDGGYNSFPIYLPGTPYYKAAKARKRLGKILNNIIISRERKEKKVLEDETDLLSCMLNSKDGGVNLSNEQIADNIIGALFAAQDTTASAMTWVVKFLHDNPKFLEVVKIEQKAIFESNVSENNRLSWNQTRNMPITNKVIVESLRIASIISFAFREAAVDIEYKGYLIPRGWKVMPLFRNIHHNPEFFAQPQNFDPTRFEDPMRPNTFLAFGSGVHACPGSELAKLEMLILVHHLASQFRYEVVGSESGIEYGPFPVPLNGLPTKFWNDN